MSHPLGPIKQTIQAYYLSNYTLLFEDNDTPVTLQFFFAPTRSGQKTYLKEVATLQRKRELLQHNRSLSYSNLNVTTQVHSMSLYQNTCKLNVWVHLHFTYHNRHETPSLESTYHRLKLVKVNGSWCIEEDVYVPDYPTIPNFSSSHQNVTTSSHRDITLPKGVYKREQAVAYAKQYALTPHPQKWKNYEHLGGDCTNFVSQCLYAGGIPFDTVGQYVTEKWYWYSDTSRTPSWTSANAFKTYMLINKGFGLVAKRTTLQDMTIGDVVQLGTMEQTTHSMLVVDVIYSDTNPNEIVDLLLAQRSVFGGIFGYNIPLSSKPSTRLYFKILGYNP